MIKHYFKVAFRNLWKYKSQTLISVVGLAVGFTCFALATLWIRYETTYDGFLKNANKLYCVLGPDANEDTGISRNTGWLSVYLKMVFPEIKRATTISLQKYMKTITIDKKDYDNVEVIGIDSSFLDMFGLKIIDGNKDFLILANRKIAITRESALKIFGNEPPIGKVITFGEHDFIVSAIVTGLPKHSNYRFDFLYGLYGGSSDGHAIIELSPNVDVKAFEKKLYEHKNLIGAQIKEMSIIPLTEIHYKDPNAEREVDFQHIVIFALAGSLVILCTLFNYLALFISRFRIRRKEMALRMVFGASGRSLFTLLSIEFALALIIALSAGIFLIEIAFPSFQLLSKTGLELSSIYLEAIVYIIAIILISLLIFIFVLMIFRRRTLNAVIHKTNKNLFRKI
ncbi:MAG: ABC transporter permease, partial [Prevotellaceae bacterium]|nr:ABC transporter permease [Prevotellaceae bacterium]